MLEKLVLLRHCHTDECQVHGATAPLRAHRRRVSQLHRRRDSNTSSSSCLLTGYEAPYCWLARAKAEAARRLISNEPDLAKAFVIAADTVVAVGRRVLGKAELEHEAGDALRLLRGRAHRVHTAICLLTPDDHVRERVVETRVRFRNLSNEEIGNYLASGEWKGKAGGYAIQGIAGAFVVKMVGSYTNVVGLPLTEVVNLLQGEGFPVSHLWLSKAEEVETE